MTGLPNTFAIYLKTRGVSGVTIKNYLSDLNHFMAWADFFFRSQNLPFLPNEPKFLTRYFDQKLVARYKDYLSSNGIPDATVNRRLSTNRAFAKFCLSQAWITQDPTKQLGNISRAIAPKKATDDNDEKILSGFKNALEKERSSSNTIKNYLSDIREFLSWLRTTA